jgi:hypothetical protein
MPFDSGGAWGTQFPIISEAASGEKMSLDAASSTG